MGTDTPTIVEEGQQEYIMYGGIPPQALSSARRQRSVPSLAPYAVAPPLSPTMRMPGSTTPGANGVSSRLARMRLASGSAPDLIAASKPSQGPLSASAVPPPSFGSFPTSTRASTPSDGDASAVDEAGHLFSPLSKAGAPNELRPSRDDLLMYVLPSALHHCD